MEDLIDAVCAGVVVIGTYVLIAKFLLRGIDILRQPQQIAIDWRIHALLRMVVLVFGISAVGVGGCLLGWIGFNVFWERQKEFTGSILSIESPIMMILFGAALIRLAILSKQRNASVGMATDQCKLDR